MFGDCVPKSIEIGIPLTFSLILCFFIPAWRYKCRVTREQAKTKLTPTVPQGKTFIQAYCLSALISQMSGGRLKIVAHTVIKHSKTNNCSGTQLKMICMTFET